MVNDPDPLLPGPRVDLMRPAPGIQRCCICFEARKIEDLFVDDAGDKWDVCGDGSCAVEAGLKTFT